MNRDTTPTTAGSIKSARDFDRCLAESSDPQAIRAFIQSNLPYFSSASAEILKNLALRLRSSSIQQTLEITALLHEVAASTHNELTRGYALWAESILRSLGYGEYRKALSLYDEAIAIFRSHGDELSPATMQISRIWSLTNLNRLEEAFQCGREAADVLRKHEKWLQLATLQMNLGATYSRTGEDVEALAMFQSAQDTYRILGGAESDEVAPYWALAVYNASISLCHLGRFQESIAAGELTLQVQQRLGNRIEVARIKQRQGVTCYSQGRYNDALKLLQEARSVFLEDDLDRHAARLDLDMCDCLLRLRRFSEALARSNQAQSVFARVETPHEEALALFYSGVAHAGQHEQIQAVEAIDQAARLFEQANSPTWVAYAELEKSVLLYRQQDFQASLALAEQCAARFHRQELPVKAGEADLQAARAELALGLWNPAESRLARVLETGQTLSVPELTFRAYHALGNLAQAAGQANQAQEFLTQSIDALESLRSRLMVEHRVNFHEDKHIVYEDMVGLCLANGNPGEALSYVGRAKSRALLDMMNHRVDLRIRARAEADRPIIDELAALRAQRDRRFRHWDNHEHMREQSDELFLTVDQDAAGLRRLEEQITELWHTLLIRNADYAQEAELWQIHSGSRDASDLARSLEPDSVLIEYFSVRGIVYVFVVSRESIHVEPLTLTVDAMRGLVERLGRQMRSVPRFPAQALPGLTRQIQVILNTLYRAIVEPIAPRLEQYKHVVVVPHDALHYLPFHALYDGSRYLIEHFAFRYLPNASLLVQPALPDSARESTDPCSTDSRILAVGYSNRGQLPTVEQEIASISRLFPTTHLLEAEAVGARVRELAPKHPIIHMATHAEMHDQQPLFSGLQLADGWLTTLDIFNLELHAALVTLSACQTGRSTIGAGDELLGLMRAFLYAGAASLVMSFWSVEDRSTAQFMHRFYARLAVGASKSAALRDAQRTLILTGVPDSTSAHRGGGAKHDLGTVLGTLPDSMPDSDYSHPYFWAPFFLVGEDGPISVSLR